MPLVYLLVRSEAHRELLAVEYGVPQYFVTFTANEHGWSDLKAHCRPPCHHI